MVRSRLAPGLMLWAVSMSVIGSELEMRAATPNRPRDDDGSLAQELPHPNFRRVRVGDGGRIVFRSGAWPSSLTKGFIALESTGATAVVDFRPQGQIDSWVPTPWSVGRYLLDPAPTVPLLNTPAVISVLTVLGSGGAGTPRFRADQVRDVSRVVAGRSGHAAMMSMYGQLVLNPDSQAAYRALLALVASQHRAVIIHGCAGRDRTGWAAALLQCLAEQPREVVVEDYLASNTALAHLWVPGLRAFREAGGDARALADLVWARIEYLEYAQHLVQSHYGAVEDYVIRGLCLSARHVDRLKERLMS